MGTELLGRRALVTGASSGIGLEIARVLASHGMALVLAARSEERLESLAATLGTSFGIEVDYVAVDLSGPAGPRTLIDAVEARGLQVDVLINNAGVGVHGFGIDHDQGREAAMLRLNVLAVAELTKHFGRGMRDRGKGWIVQVASTAAFQPCPSYAAYAASKAFVLHHAEALAEELRHTGVHVMALCPGSTNTAFFDVSGNERNSIQTSTAMEPEDVAQAAVRAMLARRRVVVTGLSNKLGTVGLRLIPRRLQAVLARKVLE